MIDIDKKIGFITGGAKGIGRAIALELAKANYNLILNYRNSEEDAKNTKTLCEQLGAEVFLIQGDISVEEEVVNIFKEIKEKYGKLDLLVNNAGITKDGLAMRMSSEDFKDVIEINLVSGFYTSREAIKMMARKREGSIINISSVVGIRGNPGQLNYSASKAGLIGMTKTLAKEMAARNIRVNAVAPGFIETDMTDALPDKVKDELEAEIPLKALGEAKDVANAVVFLASEKAKYITGQVLSVDGGMNI